MTATEQIMALLERWDRQQEGYIRQREERYEAMFQLLEDLFGRDGRFTAIDAACGPGSLGRRLLERFPAARVVALDADVMLLEIARTALAGFAERVRVVECDLTDPGWTERVAEARESLAGERPAALLFHRVALAVARRTRRVLRPGRRAARPRRRAAERRPHALRPTLAGTRGIVPEAPRAGPPGFRGQRRGQLGRLVATRRADPRLAPLKAQRDAHFARRPLRRASEDEDCSLDFHLAALRQAGFAEAATVWQQLDNYVVFARLAQA